MRMYQTRRGSPVSETSALLSIEEHSAISRYGGGDDVEKTAQERGRHMKRFSLSKKIVLVLCTVTLGYVISSAVVAHVRGSSPVPDETEGGAAHGVYWRLPQRQAVNDTRVEVYNHYTKHAPIQMYPWEHVAEPFRNTSMEVVLADARPEAALGLEVQYR